MCALIKTGSLITDIIGKIGGHVFQRTSGGLTLRTEPGHLKKRTPGQQLQRNGMVAISQEWQALSINDRNSWDTFAITFPSGTRKNPASKLSGQAHFARVASVKLNVARIYSIAPPFMPATADMSLNPPIVSVVNVVNVMGVLGVVYDYSIDHTFEFICSSFSAPLSASQQSTNAKEKVLYQSQIDGDSQNITNAYKAAWGVLPVAGQWLNITTQYFDYGINRLGNKTTQRIQL